MGTCFTFQENTKKLFVEHLPLVFIFIKHIILDKMPEY